ncbi:MAG: universal stress protein, partial [Acidobacteriota bacterium]
ADRSRPETLITIADQPWEEIGRVAQLHRCEKLLVGLGRLYDDDGGTSKVLEPLERLLSSVESDTVVLRAPQGWHPSRVQRVLVPVGGRRDHSHLRARILASLCREGCAVITFFGAVEAAADEHALALLHAELDELAQDEVGRGPDGGRATHAAIEVARVEGAIADAIVERAQASDLVVLGLRRISKRRTALGPLALRVARETQCPLLLIGRQVT